MIARTAVFALALLASPLLHAGGCFVSATSVAFGSYNEFAPSPTDSVGNVSVTFHGTAGETVAYTIQLSAGSSGSYTSRRMRPAGHHYGGLNYNLYTTAARTLVWGDGSGGSVTVNDAYTLTGKQVTRNYPVYGRIFARQKARVGTYSDYIVVTLSF